MTDSNQDGPARLSSGPHQHQPGASADGLLAVAANLSQYHREHEKYYSETPLTDAIALQRTARTLIALAERWTAVEPAAAPAPSPFAGAPDLNDDRDRNQRRAVHGRRRRACRGASIRLTVVASPPGGQVPARGSAVMVQLALLMCRLRLIDCSG
jgi:hypothetical protein